MRVCVSVVVLNPLANCACVRARLCLGQKRLIESAERVSGLNCLSYAQLTPLALRR